jgi:Polyketide cyclase / dehydrase and lipid transport
MMARSRPIRAWREVPDPPERVYKFLSQLDNHWQLGHPQLRLQAVDADGRGGHVVMDGPFGLRRTARTTVTTEERPVRFGGVAVAERTRARVLWSLEPSAAGTRVILQSTILRLGFADRVLLALGGRWWVRRAFRRVLDRLPVAPGRDPRC